jgi:hypothetical protein
LLPEERKAPGKARKSENFEKKNPPKPLDLLSWSLAAHPDSLRFAKDIPKKVHHVSHWRVEHCCMRLLSFSFSLTFFRPWSIRPWSDWQPSFAWIHSFILSFRWLSILRSRQAMELVDDLVSLSELTEDNILEHIKARFVNHKFYVSVTSILPSPQPLHAKIQ